METQQLQAQIDAMNQKLDFIIGEIELQRRHRMEMDDLKDDLTRVGKDLYQSAVVELEEVHDSLQTGDALHLTKKVLRNIRTITQSIEQLENARDFLRDFSPVSRELFQDVMRKLDDMDRKGYFAFAKELSLVGDTIVQSFSVDDVRHLGENIVTILNTVKSLTQPDMLQAVNNAVSVYKKLDIHVREDVSLISLLRDLNTPEARRGLSFAITFLKNIANPELNGSSQTIQQSTMN